MGRIIVTEFVSLDGVMEDRADPRASARRLELRDQPWGRGRQVQARRSLLGRRAAARASDVRGLCRGLALRDGEFADKFNTMPKYVVSSTLEDPEWSNSTVLKGDLVEEVAKLKQAHDGDVVVHGSAQLAQALLEHDLVDELRLMVFPVVLGTGKRLFSATQATRSLCGSSIRRWSATA